MDNVKEWQLINHNCDDVAFNFAGSPKSFATCLSNFERTQVFFDQIFVLTLR